MIFVTRIEMVSLTEIPPPCFLTSGFIQRQYPLLQFMFSLLCFPYDSHIEDRKRSYSGTRQRRLLMVVIWSCLVLRGRIHLSHHYGSMFYNLPPSLRPFCLLLFLRHKVPHPRS